MSDRFMYPYGAVRRLLLEAIAEQPRQGYELMRLAKLADDGLITGTRTGCRVFYTITERGREQVTTPTAASMQRSEERGTDLGCDNDGLEAAQRAVTDFVRFMNDEIASHTRRGELSPETARQLGTELARAREAIARLPARGWRSP